AATLGAVEAKTGACSFLRLSSICGYQFRELGAVMGRALRPVLPGQVQWGWVQPLGVPALLRWAAFQLVGVHSRCGCVVAGRTWSREVAPGCWQSQQIPASRVMTRATALVTRRPFHPGRGISGR
ncbi:MAG: hypothetical protein CMF72_24570, partial [Mameliella sp.]|nr:hypothetical protein [Mameliella sp.]